MRQKPHAEFSLADGDWKKTNSGVWMPGRPLVVLLLELAMTHIRMHVHMYM